VATTFNIIIGEQMAVIEHDTNISLMFMFLVGVIFAIIAYNLFLYLSLREPIYLVYVISSSITAVNQMILFGTSFQFLWPNNSFFQNIAPEFITSLGTIAGLVFMKMFLKTEKNAPIVDKIANIFIGFYIILLGWVWFDLVMVNRLLLLFQPLLAIYILVAAVIITVKGFEPAKYYLRAWAIFLIGIIAYVLAEKGIIERNNFTTLSLTFGAAFEVIFLSFALANRINILKREQEEAISHSLQLEKEKANLIIEQNIELEDKVAKRTHELELANAGLADTNKELSIAYTHLKNTQSQLVHAEKMSSLGQLTAGIAHEINNPINFVSSNILPLKRDVEDLISIFDQTKEFAKQKMSAEDYSFIAGLKEQYDYDYILQEIDQLLEGMSDGANRTVEIIRGLKLFSRVDEDDLKRVNLEEGLNSTLILLNSAIKHYVTLTKNYGNIPEVECYGGKMNQVFMNIISNAVQAIKSGSKEDGEITITTSHKKDFVTISIADNGPGMTQEVKDKLFEPFFTTKPVGEGTGLGLSIVYKIIDKIDGTIVVNSEPGKGTEFVITLPINNKSTD
jgi:signal transduction histidine kinase